MQLHSWSRCCEISADRFGLVCCQDANAAERAFLKLASGLPDAYLGEAGDFHEQADCWEQVKTEESGQHTHPLLAIRVRCARIFADSEYQKQLFSPQGSDAKYTAREADREAQSELDRMDPLLNHVADGVAAELRRRLMAAAGSCVIISDGDADTAELSGLVSLVGESAIACVMKQLSVYGYAGLMQRTLSEAESASEVLDLGTRIGIVSSLLVIAILDQQLHRNELAFVYAFAKRIAVPEVIVDVALAKLQEGSDPLA